MKSNNNNLKLKIALLATCFVSASLNAVTGMVPEMAQAFPGIAFSTIELITTVPSLFQMVGVLCGKFVADKVGHKNTMLAGFLFCTIGGILPVFFPLFPVIFMTRCFFGTGCGLLMSSLLALIIRYFDGNTRSTMIGFNGGISGLGSAISTFTAGQLLAFGWNYSFAVYSIGIVVILMFVSIVPNDRKSSNQESAVVETDKTSSRKQGVPLGLLGLGIMMFVSVLLATMYVIKASTLITSYGYGTAKEGSIAITFISLGSFAAGLSYGKIRKKLGRLSLPIFYIVCLAGCVLGSISNGLYTVWIGALLLGYGYLGFMPFIQEEASRCYGEYGQAATNLVLVFQSIGAFVTPYLGILFGFVSENLKTQLLMTAGCFALLTVISFIMAKKNKHKL